MLRAGRVLFLAPAKERKVAPEYSKNPWRVALSTMRTAVGHRLTGHAAECAFYATLALVPGTVIVSTTIHVMIGLGGSTMEARGKDTVISTIRFLIGPKLTDSVVSPFVLTQLTQPAGGVTLVAIILAWWMFSHLFTAAGHGLDAAYGIHAHRRSHVQRLVALSCVVVSIVIVTVTLVLMVAVQQSGQASLLVRLWTYARWPVLIVIMVGLFTGLYHIVPSVRHPLRHCVPGAVLGVVLWAGAAALFRLYVYLGAGDPTGVAAKDPRIVLIGRTVGAVIGTAIFLYFSAIAVMLGAELNADLDRRREARAEAEKALAGAPPEVFVPPSESEYAVPTAAGDG
jgi:membrane protein